MARSGTPSLSQHALMNVACFPFVVMLHFSHLHYLQVPSSMREASSTDYGFADGED